MSVLWELTPVVSLKAVLILKVPSCVFLILMVFAFRENIHVISTQLAGQKKVNFGTMFVNVELELSTLVSINVVPAGHSVTANVS